MPDRTVEHATCLGCGCACDDITVIARSGRIAEARNACSLGVAWFGTGVVPTRIVSRSGPRTVAQAIAEAAQLLAAARGPLVYLAPEMSCETQRIAIGLADRLGAMLDSATTATAAPSILAAQRRGRVSATLGEIRNRADTVLFWGVDPSSGYPRYASRYAPEPIGLYVPRGRAGRRVIAVDIGAARAPAEADERISFSPEEEVAALTLARAAVTGALGEHAPSNPLQARAARLARLARDARYLALVADGEADPTRDPRRGEALILLTDALNQSLRCALSTLRAGGNRSGADAVMTWQTGFPMAVDFTRGVPSYTPERGATSRLEAGEIDVALVLGAPHAVPSSVAGALATTRCVAIGPGASESPFPTALAIDTGIPGVHERGTAVRLDEIPLPLRPALEPSAATSFHEGESADALATAGALATGGQAQDASIVLHALAAAVVALARRDVGTPAAV